MATTLKQEFELIEQDQANAVDAFKALCKARYAMHKRGMQYREARITERQVSLLEDSVDEYDSLSYAYCRAIEETRKAARVAIAADALHTKMLDAWLEAA